MPLHVEGELSVASVIELCLLAVDIKELRLLEVEEDREPDFTRQHKREVVGQVKTFFVQQFFLEKSAEEASWVPCIRPEGVNKDVINFVCACRRIRALEERNRNLN